jgi:hypothetical protein
MMDIANTIAAFRACIFELDCSTISLESTSGDPFKVKGPGYIRQGADGGFIFRIYAATFESELHPMMIALDRRHQPCRLSAISRGGTVMSGEDVPIVIDYTEGEEEQVAAGEIAKLVLNRSGRHDDYRLRLFFFDEFDVPLHSRFEGEGRNRRQMRDGAEFEAGGIKFRVASPKGDPEMTIDAISSEPFPPLFEYRIQEALQFLTGRTIYFRTLLRDEGPHATLELIAERPSMNGAKLFPPISSGASRSAFDRDGWRLFTAYLQYIVANTSTRHWHGISYHLYNARETSSTSIHTWAIGVSVAIEAVLSLIPAPVNEETAAENLILHTAIIDFISNSEFKASLKRVKGLIAPLTKTGHTEKFNWLIENRLVTQEYVKIWKDVRNSYVHPKIDTDDAKLPDAVEAQKSMIRVHRLEVLLYQMIFHIIGYQGPYTDFSRTENEQSFTRQYPLPA